ncbi:MAG TPA: hypothetical protein VFA70_08860, partial [Dehalococcoidia bacterium]|nr:hypothetical protein [Dehalococcoidia bacterium]
MRPRLLTQLCLALLGAALIAYAVLFGANIARLLHTLTWDSDAVSTMVLAQAATHAHGTIYLSNHAQINYLAVDSVLETLTQHRGVWEFWTLGVQLLAAVLLAGVAMRAAGRWAAAAVLVGALAVTPDVAYAWNAQSFHGLTYANTVLLLAILVVQASVTARPRAARILFLAAVALAGLLTGLDLVSDALLAVTAVIPAALTGGWLALQRPAHRAAALVTTEVLLGATAAGAGLTVLATHHFQLADTPLPVHITASHLAHNVRL